MPIPTKKPIKIRIPKGKQVLWTLASQAGFTQVLDVKDSEGKSLPGFPAQAQGTRLEISTSGVFTAPDKPVTVTITANGNEERVIMDRAVINNGGSVKAETFVFAGEDANDRDFNDAFATITWFSRAG